MSVVSRFGAFSTRGAGVKAMLEEAEKRRELKRGWRTKIAYFLKGRNLEDYL